jgi:hypothetical protein
MWLNLPMNDTHIGYITKWTEKNIVKNKQATQPSQTIYSQKSEIKNEKN